MEIGVRLIVHDVRSLVRAASAATAARFKRFSQHLRGRMAEKNRWEAGVTRAIIETFSEDGLFPIQKSTHVIGV
jgi:hypothetical protein